MPQQSGFDLARSILSLRPDLPVILTSGYVRPDDQATAAAIGIRAFILKPNTVEELAVTLAALFEESARS
jgi:CheY-like chemotaxis protein